MLRLTNYKMLDEQTPQGLFELAKSYLRVSRYLVFNSPHAEAYATIFCVCHAIELTLKSFLRAKGDSIGSRRTHDIELLARAAKQNGLDVTAGDEAVLIEITRYVTGPKDGSGSQEPRYGSTHTVTQPDGKIFSVIDIFHPRCLVEVAERLGHAAWPKEEL